MRLTVDDVINVLRSRGTDPLPSRDRVQQAMESVDEARVRGDVVRGYQERFEWEVWDGRSPINGKPASEVKEIWRRRGWYDGTGHVCIKRDKVTGKVPVTQPFEPHVQGTHPIRTRARALELLKQQRDADIARRAGTAVLDAVVERLGL